MSMWYRCKEGRVAEVMMQVTASVAQGEEERAEARAVARADVMAEMKLAAVVEVGVLMEALGALLAERSQCHTCACSNAASTCLLMHLCKVVGMCFPASYKH